MTKLDEARINRYRAKKCRDLAQLVANKRTVALLNEYAAEFEAQASELELRAATRLSAHRA